MGQTSELIQEFDGKSFKEWDTWYKTKHPDSIEVATDRIYGKVQQL